jgi:hypothetical protein
MLVVDPTDKCKVVGMKLTLLDTLPTANALDIIDLGMLFVAAKFGDHQLYQFLGINPPDALTTTSEGTVTAFDKQTDIQASNAGAFLKTACASNLAPTLHPTILKNLRKIYSMDNPSPQTGVLLNNRRN